MMNALLAGTDDGVFAVDIASIAGVEVSDAAPRLCVPARLAALVPELRIGRIAGDCFFRA